MPRNKCPWFKPEEKPVRPGVYSVKVTHRGRPFYRHWNGKTWGAVRLTVNGAAVLRESHDVSAMSRKAHGTYTLLPWRGVLK